MKAPFKATEDECSPYDCAWLPPASRPDLLLMQNYAGCFEAALKSEFTTAVAMPTRDLSVASIFSNSSWGIVLTLVAARLIAIFCHGRSWLKQDYISVLKTLSYCIDHFTSLIQNIRLRSVFLSSCYLVHALQPIKQGTSICSVHLSEISTRKRKYAARMASARITPSSERTWLL